MPHLFFVHRALTIVCCGAVSGFFAANPAGAEDGPAPLFDGRTLAGWTTLDGEPVTRGWEVVDGAIHLPPSEERAGHIVTAREIGNFVLSFEFKIAPGGNSGLKYRVRDINGNILGCEYQIYDDAHPNHPVDPKNSTGSLYDVYEPVADKPLRPAGEYNSAKIVVVNDLIEHWLNGRLLLRANVGSPEWDRRIAASKFNDDPGFGENRFGKLMLTDHGSEVWYRNFEFTELPTEPAPTVPLFASSAPCRDEYCCETARSCCEVTGYSQAPIRPPRRSGKLCRPIRRCRISRR